MHYSQARVDVRITPCKNVVLIQAVERIKLSAHTSMGIRKSGVLPVKANRMGQHREVGGPRSKRKLKEEGGLGAWPQQTGSGNLVLQ